MTALHDSGPRKFGVEEEYLLLDRTTGRPSDRAADVIREIPEHREAADREFFSSQLETATPACRDAAEAEAPLASFREAAARAALRHDAVLAGTGLPPVGGEEAGTVTPKPRYRAIEAEVRGAGAHQYVTGTHVHVEVPSRDAGVDVLARLAPWAPVLLALTANSPLWCGEPTGFASWRHLMSLSWPISGYPPEFSDGREYGRAIDRLVSGGVLLDPGIVTWTARLSNTYPTVELRIADAQLEVGDAVTYAVIVRALVERCLVDADAGRDRPDVPPGVVDGAAWLAARNGLDTELLDPLSDTPLPAFELVDQLVTAIEPELDRAGDLARVERYVARLREDGSPARRQLRRFEESGIGGMLDLYRSASTGGARGVAGDPPGR